MNKADLLLMFKHETGIRPITETVLELEECEYIDDYYLVSKTDADAISENNSLNITRYSPKYIEWLEEHFKN